MNTSGSIIQTPFHQAHSHFYDYIPDFPGLPVGDNYADNHEKIMTNLRFQLMHPFKNYEDDICLRSCFKLSEKKYVNFCLQKKCKGIDFDLAAKYLKYAKVEEKSQTKVVHQNEKKHH